MGHADEFNGPNQGLLLNPGDYNVKVTSQAGSTLLEEKVTIQQDKVLDAEGEVGAADGAPASLCLLQSTGR